MALLHIVGVTPEAPSESAAFGGNRPQDTFHYGAAERQREHERAEDGGERHRQRGADDARQATQQQRGRRQHAAGVPGRHHGLEAGEDAALQAQVFGRSLEHILAGGEVGDRLVLRVQVEQHADVAELERTVHDDDLLAEL